MPQKNDSKTLYAISFALQLGFFIPLPIISFLFLGFWLDKLIGTGPLFLIVGVLLGIIIAAYMVYGLLIPLIKDKEND